MSKLPKSASVAEAREGAMMHAPAAARNAEVLTDLICRHAPAQGRALEIASGTGQHVISFATARTNLMWYPTEIAADRRASIDAYRAQSGLRNVAPAAELDATAPDWAAAWSPLQLVVVVNLLHLISDSAARAVLSGAMATLEPGGRFVLYGPFKRGGVLTSDGDARFDAQLREADPEIGYKDDADISAWLRAAGAASVAREEMPANNLAFIARR